MTATRRLAAILSADVVGFSRLMEADEAGTLARLKVLRREVMDTCFAIHNGRTVKLMGDGVLVEFASVVDAVQCAVALQEAMRTAEPGQVEGNRIVIRIGVNLGDVIIDGDDIYGDGVNVAARLQALASPGSVAISGTVREHVAGKLAVTFEDLGEHVVKNIERPVRVYRAAAGDAPVAAAGSGGREPARSEKISIAVLPFDNMSSDPEQDYFADGITEDIITDLARWTSLAVASRNAAFRFKAKPVDIQRVGRELGVGFVVEGSVRRMGERIRITAQLIHVESGNHVWAERFDRPMADLFVVQDEVVRTIVGTLVGRVYASEVERTRRKPPASLAAYDHVLRGNALPWDEPASAAEARHAFERAIELDPGYGTPHSLLAVMLNREWENDFSASPETLNRALVLAQRGVELSASESICHGTLGLVYHNLRAFDLALRHIERSIEVNPASQWSRADLGFFLALVGRAEEGLEMLRSARRADPYFGPPWYWRSLGVAQFVLRRYAEALADFRQGGGSSPAWALGMMAGCCAKLGLSAQAGELLAQCLAREPRATIVRVLAKVPFKFPEDSEHLGECLRLAGFPE